MKRDFTVTKRLARITLAALTAGAMVFSVGCGFVHRNTIGLFTGDEEAPAQTQEGFSSPTPEHPASRSAAAAPVQPAPRNQTDIEIVWEIPKDPVDAFVIRFGSTRTELSSEVRVTPNEIERYEDATFGFVYRYFLKGMNTDNPVYVTIAAVRGTETSPPSQVFEVQPR